MSPLVQNISIRRDGEQPIAIEFDVCLRVRALFPAESKVERYPDAEIAAVLGTDFLAALAQAGITPVTTPTQSTGYMPCSQ
jgi:hypothetical protein